MAEELWGEASQLRRRLLVCGHSYGKGGPPSEIDGHLCQHCLSDDMTSIRAMRVWDTVPKRDLSWEGAALSKSHKLTPVRRKAPMTRSAHLAAAMSQTNAHVIDLQQAKLTSDSTRSTKTQFVVLRCSSGGCVARMGAIATPEHGLLLLEGLGSHFVGISFTGGGVLCVGESFSGTFRGCAFYCTVTVAHGASATFTSCSFHGRMGLLVSGPATSATLFACRFVSCMTGVVAERGASVSADHTIITRAELTGIVSNNRGTRVQLQDCAVMGYCGGDLSVIGVNAHGGAICMRSCAISGFRNPVNAIAATVETTRMSVCASFVGLMVHRSSRLAARDCGITLRAKPSLLQSMKNRIGDEAACDSIAAVSVSDARVQLERCGVSGGAACGVSATEDCRVAATLCQLEASENAVRVLDPGSRAWLAHCNAAGGEASMCVNHTLAELHLLDCSVTGADTGVQVAGGAIFHARRCDFTSRGTREVSACVTTFEATTEMIDCAMHTANHGLSVVESTGTARRCTVRGIAKMPRVKRRDRPDPGAMSGFLCMEGTLRVEGGSVTGCEVAASAPNRPSTTIPATLEIVGMHAHDCRAGVQASPRTAATIRDCKFSGRVREEGADAEYGDPSWSAAVFLNTNRYAIVERCEMEGFKWGVDVAGKCGTATVRECALRGSSREGSCVRLSGLGSVDVERCTLREATIGVNVQSGSAEMHDCETGPDVHTGVLVDGGKFTAVGAKFKECQLAMGIGGSGEIAVQDCVCTGCHEGLRLDANRFKVTAKRLRIEGGNMTGVSVEAHHAPGGTLKLVDCVFKDTSMGVYAGGRHLDASLLRCEVAECETCVHVGTAAVARLREVRLVRGRLGLFAGDAMEELFGCSVCGKTGAEAGEARRRAVRAVPPLPDGARPRCVHEGARAMVSMHDCELRGCTDRGICVRCDAHVDARRVRATGCKKFLEEMWGHVPNSFEDCRVVHPRDGEHFAVTRVEDVGGRPGKHVAHVPGITIVRD